MEKSDVDIIKAYLDGDADSLRFLVSLYLKKIYNFVFQYVLNAADAEDITQDVFIKVCRNLEKFDLKKNFKTWIFSIAKNTAIDFMKKKKSIPFSTFENERDENLFEEGLADREPFPDELLRRKDIEKQVNKAVEGLPAPYRVVLFLYYYDGFNLREIAEILGESEDTVKSRHRRALIMLKKSLAELT